MPDASRVRLESGHVFVATPGEPDENAHARIRLREPLRTGQRVRAFDSGQDALGSHSSFTQASDSSSLAVSQRMRPAVSSSACSGPTPG